MPLSVRSQGLALVGALTQACSSAFTPPDKVVEPRAPADEPSAPPAPPSSKRHCPPGPDRTVKILGADPQGDPKGHRLALETLASAVKVPNTTVLLEPNVVLDFSQAADLLPLELHTCVTLTSAASLRADPVLQPSGAPAVARSAGTRTPAEEARNLPSGPARTPHSPGPLLKFGAHPRDEEVSFLLVDCPVKEPPDQSLTNDHVRISGFRLEGPNLGQQVVTQFGIFIHRCLDVEVSNMEIFGWGGAGVRVNDDGEGPGQEAPLNLPGDRIGRPDQIRIFGNHIHHNQHASESESVDCEWSWSWAGLKWVGCELGLQQSAAGYGVAVHHGAWAQIHSNLFDMNRHAIAGAGNAGGYDARYNLVLKGGGYHGRAFHTYTHQFDIHGTSSNGQGGQAGTQSWFFANSFQFLNAPAIKVRGRPAVGITIGDNVFAHEGLEDDRGDDAVHVWDRNDLVEGHSELGKIQLASGNVTKFDSYGRYGVCDFDADGIDDLFLATGKTWWFSSFGEFPWSYLSAHTETLDQMRLGYFDAEAGCDVLTQSGEQWVIASAGAGEWKSIGSFGAPLSEVQFGRFDPSRRDHRAGATRATTHAFRRLASGQWQVTPLSAPAWQEVQSSQKPMKELRFGDFTGDGVTDVLGMDGGHWAISESARGTWQELNHGLADDVASLFIVDVDNDNIDDILKLVPHRQPMGQQQTRLRYTWFLSKNGRSPWQVLKAYDWTVPNKEAALAGHAFAGRFGVAPGGGVLLVDASRVGNFFAPLETAVGAAPDWHNSFSY
jgi:hypothetical protein